MSGAASVGRPAPVVPRAIEFPAILLYVLLAAASAAVCSQINVFLGITPNTAVVGVLVAMALGRTILPAFGSAERQVMIETATSAGGFAGANIALVSIAALYLVHLERLLLPLLAGISLGMVIDIWLAYRLFGTRAFPADAAWPDGEAVGRVIQAGDEGGTLARQLLQGIGVGIVGRAVSLPMAGVGIAFIGNAAALSALAVGLLVRAYAPAIAGYDFSGSYLPHGLMIGAGLVQVSQTAWLFWRTRSASSAEPRAGKAGAVRARVEQAPGAAGGGPRSGELVLHFGAFVAAAALVSVLAGLWTGVPGSRALLWIGFAGLAALIHTIIVGYCAMLSGWFPSFAVAIALILVGALLRFPLEALVLLAGFVLSTGPQFADLGFDLKSGWIIRGRGVDPVHEAAGRRQQVWLQEIGALVGIVTATLAFTAYWKLGLVPPMSRVVEATIKLAVTGNLGSQLLVGAVLGAAAQTAGGARRALGILLATGLLLDNAIYGWALAVALFVRWRVGTARMAVRAPGLIAGDGLAGFALAIARAF
jgi:uncharacterized oligopeptide transporter (OPT) family protein